MRVGFIKGDVRDETTSTKMLSQSEILKKMAAETAEAAEKLAAKKAAKVEKARKPSGDGGKRCRGRPPPFDSPVNGENIAAVLVERNQWSLSCLRVCN